MTIVMSVLQESYLENRFIYSAANTVNSPFSTLLLLVPMMLLLHGAQMYLK